MKKCITKILCLFPAAFVTTIAASSISSCGRYSIDSIVIDGFTTMHMNDVQTFYAIIKPQDKPTNDVVWSVDKESIGSINKKTGEFKALAKGQVTVTATWTYDKKFTASKQITILDPSPREVLISGDNSPRVGRDSTYEAVVKPDEAIQTVNWLISDEYQDIATIDKNGKLHPKKTGNITIYAQSVYDPNIIGFKNITIDVPIAQDFRTDSWDTIIYFIENGGYEALYNAYQYTQSFRENDNSFVGLERELPITMNNKTVVHKVVVIGVNHDTIYDSTTNEKAALTFEFRNLLWDGEDTGTECEPMYIRWNPPFDYGKQLNFWYLNENLYSEIRLQLSTKVRDLIDSGLGRTRDNSPLKTVVKMTNTGGDDKAASEVPIESHDEVFILSLSEVYSDIGINWLTTIGGHVVDIYYEWAFYKHEGERYEYWEKRIGDYSPVQGYEGDEGTNAFAPGAIGKADPIYSGYWFRSPRLRSVDTPYEYQDNFYKNCFAYHPANAQMFREDNFDAVNLVEDSGRPADPIGILPCFCI